MFKLLNPGAAREILELHSAGVPVPWAFVKSSVFQFVDALRIKGCLFGEATEKDTAEHIQHVLTVDGKNLELAMSASDSVTILRRDEARRHVDALGREVMGLGWNDARDTVFKFMDHLYYQNVFLARAELGVKSLALEKTQTGTLSLRLRKQPVE